MQSRVFLTNFKLFGNVVKQVLVSWNVFTIEAEEFMLIKGQISKTQSRLWFPFNQFENSLSSLLGFIIKFVLVCFLCSSFLSILVKKLWIPLTYQKELKPFVWRNQVVYSKQQCPASTSCILHMYIAPKIEGDASLGTG